MKLALSVLLFTFSVNVFADCSQALVDLAKAGQEYGIAQRAVEELNEKLENGEITEQAHQLNMIQAKQRMMMASLVVPMKATLIGTSCMNAKIMNSAFSASDKLKLAFPSEITE